MISVAKERKEGKSPRKTNGPGPRLRTKKGHLGGFGERRMEQVIAMVGEGKGRGT